MPGFWMDEIAHSISLCVYVAVCVQGLLLMSATDVNMK